MGATSYNGPFRYDNVEEIVQSANQFNKSSQDKDQIKINSFNISVNGKEIIYKLTNYSYKDETKDNTKQEQNGGQAFLTICIKSEFGTIQLQVKSSEKVSDVTEKYKCKLQKDNIKSIFFYTEENILMDSNRKLEEFNIKNNSQINAKIEFNNNINNVNNNTYVTSNENIKMKNKAYTNLQIPPDKLSELKKEIKEKNKQGLRAIVIKSSTQKTEFFYVEPDVKFKIIAEEYKKINPDNEWIFLFNGALIIDTEKTIEELKMKNLSVIVAHCN